MITLFLFVPIPANAQKSVNVESKYKDVAYEMLGDDNLESLNDWVKDMIEIFPNDETLIELHSNLISIEPFLGNLSIKNDDIENITTVTYKNLDMINTDVNLFSYIEVDNSTKQTNLLTEYGLILDDWIFFRSIVLKIDDEEPYKPTLRQANKDEIILDNSQLLESTMFGNEGNIYTESKYEELNEPATAGTLRFKGQKDIDIELTEDELTGMFTLARLNEYYTDLQRYIKR